VELERIGKYRIIDELGAGGMGTVYRARHEQLDRIVALKIIKERYAGQQGHLDRFKREAAVCADLHHDNIIQMYDYGEENGVIFYAMELLDADTLDEYLEQQGGKLSLGKLMKLAEPVFSALAYIHARGIVHRDLKPANIMIGKDGRVTIMDFGLVKALEKTALTRDGKAIGTPRYMSPEMLRAEDVDGRSDVFQVGLVLYEAATGELPFKGNDIYVLARNILTAEPERPSKLAKGLGRHFDALVLNCLEKDKADRYQSADEALADVQRLQKRLPVKLRRQTPDRPVTADEPPSDVTSSSGTGTVALTISTSLSRMGLSTLSHPINLLAETLNPRQLVALVVLVLATLLGAYLFFGGSGVPYLSTDVQVQPDIDAVQVTWRSNQPYATAVYLKEADLPATNGRLVQEPTETTTCMHALVLDNLKRGVRYEFQIAYPDGRRSLPYVIEPLLHDRLQLIRSSVEWPSLTELRATYETNVPCRATLRYRWRSEQRQQALGTEPSIRHPVAWTDIRYDEVLSDAVLHLVSVRHAETIALGDIHGPARPCNAMLVALADFRPEPLLARLGPELRELARTEASDKTADRILAELRHVAAWQRFTKLRHLMRPIFASPTLSVESVKMPLYVSLRKFDMVDGLLDFNGARPVTEVAADFQPFLTLSHGAEAPPGDFLELAAYSEADSSFVPVDMGADGQKGFEAALLKGYQKFNQMPSKERLVLSKDLTDFLRTCGDRPRLTLRTRNFRPEFFFRVTVNGAYVLDLRNTSATAPPTMWLAISNAEPDTPEYNKAVNFVSLNVPKSLFRSGQNDFTVELHVLPGTNTTHFVQMRSLRLYRH